MSARPVTSAGPGPLVGILGGGQLGRMLALAAAPLGVRVRVFDPSLDCCAGQVTESFCGDFKEFSALDRFAADCDLFTYEWENVPAAAAQRLQTQAPVYPDPSLLEVAQDRLQQKSLLDSLGVPVPPFAAVESLDSLKAALDRLGTPAVLKTRRDGYDGRGQAVLKSPEDAEAAWNQLGAAPAGLILEAFVRFSREVSLIAVRSTSGAAAFYPLGENEHHEGILRVTHAPAVPAGHPLQAEAEGIARTIFSHFDYVGVLSIEFFELDGHLLVNEMATRVHNSGHWTMDGAAVSQFENHMRAILGWPLGSTEPLGHSIMVNLIGRAPAAEAVLGCPAAHLHLYGKSPRHGRKLGHINIVDENQDAAEAMAAALRAQL